jgi:L-asparaginase II
MMKTNPLLVEALRGSALESAHRGAVANQRRVAAKSTGAPAGPNLKLVEVLVV